MRKTKIEFTHIPELLQKGKSKADIAEMYGVTIGTLSTLCSQKGVSLRRNGHNAGRKQRINMGKVTLMMNKETLDSLHKTAVEMKYTTTRLIVELLEKIAKDDLYKAVLDV